MYYTKGQKKKYPPRGTVNIVFRTSCHAGSGRNTNTSAAHLVTVSPFAQETFSVSQTDQHSDLTDEDASIFPNYGNGCCRGFPPRFPDPRSRSRNRQCTLALCAMICVYSFVAIIIPRCFQFCKRIEEFCDKNTAVHRVIVYGGHIELQIGFVGICTVLISGKTLHDCFF